MKKNKKKKMTSFDRSQDRAMARLYSVSQTKERMTGVECDLFIVQFLCTAHKSDNKKGPDSARSAPSTRASAEFCTFHGVLHQRAFFSQFRLGICMLLPVSGLISSINNSAQFTQVRFCWHSQLLEPGSRRCTHVCSLVLLL